MLSNAYFVAKFRFDTAENEPVKNLQNLAKKVASEVAVASTETGEGSSERAARGGGREAPRFPRPAGGARSVG